MLLKELEQLMTPLSITELSIVLNMCTTAVISMFVPLPRHCWIDFQLCHTSEYAATLFFDYSSSEVNFYKITLLFIYCYIIAL